MAEDHESAHEKSLAQALERWREAERHANAEDPDSVEGHMLRERVAGARKAFHELEQEVYARKRDERSNKSET